MSGIGGPGRDERWALIDLRATAFAGTVLVAAVVGARLRELSRGHDGSLYGQLLGVGGIAYIVAIAVLRHRA